ncbi:SRPBCC family protein [Streptomyces sp. NPDC058867]|uniref:SRPBCC family protein n=1 Tax=Streptomyces sp. NPDC058867 TaxID=3346657 RepID=UPI0036CAE2CE
MSNSTDLPTPAAAVWSLVSDFGRAATWQPHVASAEMQADGNRRLTFASGGSVIDRIFFRNDDARILTYGIADHERSVAPGGGPMLLTNLRATIEVSEMHEGCQVTYTIQADVDDERLAAVRKGVDADVNGSLARLADLYRGEGVQVPSGSPDA